MAAGEEQKKVRKKSPEADVELQPPAAHKSADTAKIDSLIDEIDEVLEENAEEFVRSYVQKGGQ